MRKRIKYVPYSSELLEEIFSKARKEVGSQKFSGRDKAKEMTQRKIKAAGRIYRTKLQMLKKKLPKIEQLPEFYRKLIELHIGEKEIKKSFGQLSASIDVELAIERRTLNKLNNTTKKVEYEKILKEFYGKLSSIVKKNDHSLSTLRALSKEINLRHVVRLDLPSFVIAGYPNVGKSTLLKALTEAKPEIAEYPFTTKKIIIGTTSQQNITIQLIDTPGLLDRPINEKNKIELESILALKHLADGIIFVFDPSETCGYDLQKQASLYNWLKKEFNTKIWIVLNKKDLMGTEIQKEIKRRYPQGILLHKGDKKKIRELKQQLFEYAKKSLFEK